MLISTHTLLYAPPRLFCLLEHLLPLRHLLLQALVLILVGLQATEGPPTRCLAAELLLQGLHFAALRRLAAHTWCAST